MAAIKSYTDIEQSRKLAEFLPLESADMWWAWYSSPLSNGHYDNFPIFCKPVCNLDESVPCWSLAALIGVLPKGTRLLKSATDDTYHCDCPKENIDKWYDNEVDACVDIIEELHKLKLL